MKNIIHYSRLAVFIFSATVLFSCNKSFLEITPKGKLIASTTNDYQLVLTNLDLLNMGTDAQVAMGDEVAAIEPFFTGSALRTQRLFHWDDIIYQPDEDAAETEVPMSNIYLYNKVINEVMASAEGTEQEKIAIRAQAMAGRAWTYFLLINYYGKPYNAASSASDPGFPIILDADVTATKFTRASVKEVYDFIVTDLETAIPDLPARISHRLVMSKAAAQGILGKVYMFMGNYDSALPLLNDCVENLGTAEIPVGLYDYNSTFAPGGLFMPLGLFGANFPTAPNHMENIYAKQVFNLWTFTNNEFVVTAETAALYGSSDLRLNCYSNMPFPAGSVFPNNMLRKNSPISAQIGVVASDIYLLQAECKARLNDLSGAVNDLEYFRSNRMPPADAPVPSSVASDKVSLVKFILEERIREFAMMGFRWFDMRRLSTDPEYSATVGSTHSVYDADGNITATYTLKPERLVLRFPQKLMNQNPGMENNP